MAVEDRNKASFAWYQPKFKPIRWLGKGKQREYKFIAYQYKNVNKPKTQLEPITFDRNQMGYMLAFFSGQDSYVYFFNPLKKMKKCIKYDINGTDETYEEYFKHNH